MKRRVVVWRIRRAVMAIVTIAFGVGVIAGRPVSAGGQPAVGYEYRVLATNRTSTMTVGKTAMGGKELVAIVRRSGQP